MKNNTEIVHIFFDVWYKTQDYGRGKKINDHTRRFYNVDEAIDFFNKESSATKIDSGVTIRNSKFMYGNGDTKTIFEKGISSIGKPIKKQK